MQSERNLHDYYSRKFNREKSAIGRALDFILLRLSFFTFCYTFLVLKIRNAVLSLGLAISFTILLSLWISIYKSAKMEKFITRLTEEIYENKILESLMLLPQNAIVNLIAKHKGIAAASIKRNKNGFIHGDSIYIMLFRHHNDRITASQILEAYRFANDRKMLKCEIYSTSTYDEECFMLAGQFDNCEVTLIPPDTLIHIAKAHGLVQKDKVVEESVMREIAQRKANMKKINHAFLPGSAKKYFYCAALIGISTLLTGYRVYYPIMAAVCFCLGLLSWYFNKEKEKNRQPNTEP